ncbi:uncharacterized protein LOC143060988 [Mytilus galloprovincialis]|uniref:Mitochondria-eating protein C-terminal domain-containing protein n=2 Tax=Mytilus TaxID=6548 RepID=A0A8B6BJ05_MYTGA|nr:unnamed protein product [Mytilus edulis]VDH90960.1 Hypothetical predicted protein [Mytilus galloprovincialis]
MSRFKYELKCKLDRLNEEMKSWIKQVDYAIRLWSRLPDSTLYESYEQVLTLMYRKLESAGYKKLKERQTTTIIKRSTSPETRAIEFELRKTLEMEMLKSINLLEALEKEKIKRKLVEDEMRETKRKFEKSNVPPKYIVNERDSSMDKDVDQLLELDKQIAEHMDEIDIPGSSAEGLVTDRSGGLSTDRTVSEQTNTPAVLTEVFKSVFNNEWNDCFTELTKRYTDDHAIELLRRWLKECYFTCVALTKEQRKNIKDDTLKCFFKFMQSQAVVSLSDKCKKYIRTYQKKTAKEALPLIEQLCTKRITRGQNFGTAATDYIKKCAEVCWIMNVQNPSIFLDFDLRYGYVIDQHSFSTFRKHGDYVNYVVWPAVYLNRNGPILCKGIVESQ